MNQVTNLIQWKNLTDEEKADFDFENYKYEVQDSTGCVGFCPSNVSMNIEANSRRVYQLVIEDYKWYFAHDEVKIGKYCFRDEIEEACECRPARPDEIPVAKERTLEQKIEDKWPDKDVVMLKRNECLDLVVNSPGLPLHINAQSMKGFFKYVYVNEGGGLYIEREPTDYCENTGKTIQPVAVLFEGEG